MLPRGALAIFIVAVITGFLQGLKESDVVSVMVVMGSVRWLYVWMDGISNRNCAVFTP